MICFFRWHNFDTLAHETPTCCTYLAQIDPSFDLCREFESVVAISTEISKA